MADVAPLGAEITVAEAHAAYGAGDATFVDVREPDEWAAGHIPGAMHVPLATLPEAAAALPAGPLVLVCRSGARSERATEHLMRRGRTNVANLTGGMLDWEAAGYPSTLD